MIYASLATLVELMSGLECLTREAEAERVVTTLIILYSAPPPALQLSLQKHCHSFKFFLSIYCTMQPNSYSRSHELDQVEIRSLLTDQEPPNFDLDLSCRQYFLPVNKFPDTDEQVPVNQSTDDRLPAIIITPCRPSSPFDYEIAFLASNKDNCRQGVWAIGHSISNFIKLSHNYSRRARIAFCIALPTTVIGVHLLVNHYLTSRAASGIESWPNPFPG